jgi:hypothetical protein
MVQQPALRFFNDCNGRIGPDAREILEKFLKR